VDQSGDYDCYNLQVPPDYEFAVQQVLRQLEGICDRIVGFAGRHGADIEELGPVVRDIYGHTLRGMALSVAGLSWFELGLPLGPECEHLRDKALKILRKLRSEGFISMSELLKNHLLKKQERDALLAHLAEENLVRVEGKSIVATTYKEFVQGTPVICGPGG
jgi:hypothetical protein